MADTLRDIQYVRTDPNLEPYEATIKKWEQQLSCICFIYDSILEDRKKIMSVLTLFSLISTSLASVMSILDFAVENTLAIKIITTVVIITSALFTSTVKILGYEDFISQGERYYTKAENLLAKIVARDSLPTEMRDTGEEFVKSHKDRYFQVLIEAPNLPNRLYEKYRDKYFNLLGSQESTNSSKSKRKALKFM